MRALLSRLFVSLALFAAGVGGAQANCMQDRSGQTLCPPAQSRCVADRYGDPYCSAPGGDVMQDRLGNVVCGVGRCVKDFHGNIKCSNEPHGSAGLDRYSEAVCTSGCAPATAQACTKLTK